MKLKNGEKIKPKDLKYKANNHIYYFQQFETIRSFGSNVYIGKISIDEAKMGGTNLLESLIEFNNKSRPKKDRQNKEILLIV